MGEMCYALFKKQNIAHFFIQIQKFNMGVGKG